MKNILVNTFLQSSTALVAMASVPNDIVLPQLPNADLKHEIIAVGASVLVQVLKWAFIKYIKPILSKNKIIVSETEDLQA